MLNRFLQHRHAVLHRRVQSVYRARRLDPAGRAQKPARLVGPDPHHERLDDGRAVDELLDHARQILDPAPHPVDQHIVRIGLKTLAARAFALL